MADAYAIIYNFVPFCPVSADLFICCGFVYCFAFYREKQYNVFGHRGPSSVP